MHLDDLVKCSPPTNGNFKDLTGKRSGRLLITGYAGKRGSALRPRHYWFADCDCGQTTIVGGFGVNRGRTWSCGCGSADLARGRGTHREAGHSRTPEFDTWAGIRQRCFNPKHPGYKWYGGRGITLVARWDVGEDGRSGYECFVADMGRRPTPSHSIDRIDNDGPYAPWNCRWVTQTEQQRNRRNNHREMIDGRLLCLAEISEQYDVPYARLKSRLRIGWPIEKAAKTPLRGRA